MPSTAYTNWATVRAAALDAVEHGHTAIRGTGPGRREATRQLNHAYVVLLAAELQGFCRELHTEAVGAFTAALPAGCREIVREEFTWNRQLDRGNANPSTLGSDFGRLGLDWWAEVDATAPDGPALRRLLEDLNRWRNAVAHNDFDPAKLGVTMRLRLGHVRRWRASCRRLARVFDRIMAGHIFTVTGRRPW